MARTKSPSSGSKSKKEKNGVASPVIPDANPVAAEAPVASANQVESASQANEVNGKAHAAVADASPSQPVPAPETRKFELHKSEPRRNVVPINVEDEIRRRAYELFLQRGQGSGNQADDWLAAEREVMQRYRQQQRA